MRPSPLLLVLALLAAALPALAPAATAQVPEGRNEVRLAVLEYHPYPDMDGDPFGFWATNSSGNLPTDWMRGYYGALSFPTARFDGVGLVANSPDSRPQEFEADYRREFDVRTASESPFILNVSGTVNATHATVTVKVVNRGADTAGMTLRGALFTDDVAFAAPNLIENHRFLARARFSDTPLDVPVGASVTHVLTIKLPPEHDGKPLPQEDLGVVFYVQNEGDGGRFKVKEVLQSAMYYFRQTEPTVQSQKAVLLELYTATWCEACLHGDLAVGRLAKEYGVASTLGAGSPWAYFRGLPSVPVLLVGTALGALAAAFVLPLARRGRPKA